MAHLFFLFLFFFAFRYCTGFPGPQASGYTRNGGSFVKEFGLLILALLALLAWKFGGS
jgi:hypothetical protein